VIALVTGGNRGIGKAICEGLAEQGSDVWVGSRDLVKGKELAAHLRGRGYAGARAVEMNVADDASVEACAAQIGPVDILVNNAGVFLIREDPIDPWNTDEGAFKRTLEVNLHGAWRTTRRFVPLMTERGYGRVVNVSSAAGSLAAMPSGCGAAYCVSKASLNALTKLTAEAVDGSSIKVNAMCPGYVRTDMGFATGGEPTTLPAEAADTAVWLATLDASGPNGGFFRDREPIDW
jgi:NAD(P)-dependent dehydrogenase (short-subunit alcohol dehydrogenase family)